MPASGLGFDGPVRSFRNFFGTYGTVGGAIRGLANFIIPVAVVDRYRDDDEGSLFGLTMTATVPAGRFAAFAIGSPQNDWELHGLNAGYFISSAAPPRQFFNYMVYTPDSSFIPVQTPAPAGLFVPGLNTDFAFTLGSVTGIAGHNPAPPPRFGFFSLVSKTLTGTVDVPSTFFQAENSLQFDPPIRFYRDVTCGVMVAESTTQTVDHTVSVLYRERPRTTDGPRTG